MLKYRNHYRGGQTTNKTPQDRKIKLGDIEFDEEKLRNLLSSTQNRDAINMLFILMMVLNLTANLVRKMLRPAMRKLLKRKKRLKQGTKL